jgi:hypothetical protein
MAISVATSRYPLNCHSKSSVDSFVQGFLRAVNQDDRRLLKSFFPARSAHLLGTHTVSIDLNVLQDYMVIGPGGRHFETDRREALLAYFARRHQHHEVLRLLSLRLTDVTYYAGTPGVGLGFRLVRKADDVLRSVMDGKGEINCTRGEFAIWLMWPPPGTGSSHA